MWNVVAVTGDKAVTEKKTTVINYMKTGTTRHFALFTFT